MPSRYYLSYHHALRVFLMVAMIVIAINNAAAQNSQPYVQPIGTVIEEWDPNLVNQYLEKWDTHITPATAPFDTSYPVSEVQPTQAMRFVRLYSGSYLLGGWLVRASVIRNLTPEQIRNILALPEVPTNIAYVKVPIGSQYGIWTGIAGEILSPGHEWGQGGAEQTRVIGPHSNLSAPADPARFAGYDYLPKNNYMNAELIGNSALSYYAAVSSGNAGNVAAYLDSHLPQPYSEMEDVYTTLDYINADGPPELAVALMQLSPISFDSYSTIFFRNDLLFNHILFEHTQTGYANTGAKTSKDAHSQGSAALANKRCFAAWMNVTGEEGEQSQSSNRVGFSYQTGMITGGGDCQISPKLKIGFGVGYLRDHLGWNASAGAAEINNAQLGVYSSYQLSDYFLNGSLTGGYHWSSAQRNLNFAGEGIAVLTGTVTEILVVDSTASSNPNGENVGLNFVGGKNFQFNEWNLTPSAQILYFYSRVGSFNEGGADDLDLDLQYFSAQTIRTQLALLLGKKFNLKQGSVIKANIQLGWAHNFPLDNRVITASFPVLGGTFSVNGFNQQTNELLASANLTSQVTKKFWINAQYIADLSHGFNSQSLSLIFKYYFDV